MARWDDLQRVIDALDPESTERIWLELLETDLENVEHFLGSARRLSERPGGRRQAGILLWMLAESLKEGGQHRSLISVYSLLARLAPDDGTLRDGLVEASRQAFPDRPDLDSLFEKSGVVGGGVTELGQQAAKLDAYLRLAPGTYVYHRSGWGAGRIVDYVPERERCVIDFQSKPGHEMDIDAAAERLERLADDDIRAMAIANPRGVRKFASDQPLEVLRQVLNRFDGTTNLRHLKDALVPDAVATSRWSTWWKEAKKQATLDPRFHVGGGRDPRVEYYGSAHADFGTQVERTFKGCATVLDRQKAAREFLVTSTDDPAARETLTELVRVEAARVHGVAASLGWKLVMAELEGSDRGVVLEETLAATDDPIALLARIDFDDTRASLAKALAARTEDGPDLVYRAALDHDDPVLGEVASERFPGLGRENLLTQLLDEIDRRPALTPSLYAWYVRGVRRHRWSGRSPEPLALMRRLLKVLDAVEYRSRRGGSARDAKGVTALVTLLAGNIVKEAADVASRDDARHLIQVIEKNRGIKARQLQKMQTTILRSCPDALKEEEVVEEGEPHVGERLDRVYMTAAGMVTLKAQRDRILNEDLVENAKEIARAREFGDLSENAEYHAARERQGLLQAKADAMSSDLSRAAPLTPDLVRTDTVSVGTRVRLHDAQDHEITYTLLGPPDVDVKSGIINYLTPLGQALMGKAVGEHVEVVVGEEKRDVVVLAIENALDD